MSSASAELRRLLTEATPGPWLVQKEPPWLAGPPLTYEEAALIVYLVNHASVLADLIDAAAEAVERGRRAGLGTVAEVAALDAVLSRLQETQP